MMNNTYKRGFTLIELLVVIAIIGILASVVLASLNSARDKGADAAVKANLGNIRAQAAIVYDTDNSYDDVCGDPTIAGAVTAAKTAVSGTVTAGGLGDGDCNDTPTAWAAWVNLKSASTSAQCVDSTGASKVVAAQNNTVDITVCP